MKLLLDTPVLIWALSEPERIKPKVQYLLIDANNMVFISVASLWELTIKKSLNKNFFTYRFYISITRKWI
ncbi:MAG: type II toxin-antitoxin system VapC family toxin [Alphaproteobacteria bacterium]|nr:type II toxin-antitoxin system VapC family toxin [Alphaproteobacteria bacterium]